MLVKVINGCSLNSRFWVFYAATTNVGLTVFVTDEQTGHQQQLRTCRSYGSGHKRPALPVTGRSWNLPRPYAGTRAAAGRPGDPMMADPTKDTDAPQQPPAATVGTRPAAAEPSAHVDSRRSRNSDMAQSSSSARRLVRGPSRRGTFRNTVSATAPCQVLAAYRVATGLPADPEKG
jgi:hypothetical protein